MAQQKTINTTGSGAKTIHDVATADRTNVLYYAFMISGAGTVTLTDEAGTEFARYTAPAAGLWVEAPPSPGGPLFTAKGDIVLTPDANVTLTGHFGYAANHN